MADDLPAASDPRTVGACLREAREARGWTQQQAAAKLGVARTTMVAIEKGERRVQPEELVELAKLYDRRISDLLRREAPVESLAAQLRRPLSPAEPSAAELLPAIRDFEQLCEDYLHLERLREAPLRRRYPPPYDIDGVEPELAAEDVAAQERRRLGLGDGPLLGLRAVLENDVGMRVFGLTLPPNVAALYAYSEDLGGCMAVNRDHPAERQRLSLAHEYGHLLTSRFRPEVLRDEQYRRQPAGERFAEAFARSFLVPAEGVRRRFLELRRERGGKSPTFGDLCRLAHLYAMSIDAMLRRLEELSLVPPGSGDRLQGKDFAAREAQRLFGLEPLAASTELLPVRYAALALEAWTEGQLSEGQLARLLRATRLEARERLAALRAADPEAAPGLSAPLLRAAAG